MKKLLHITAFAMLLLPVAASAQFYTAGDDPAGKWYSIESPNYKVLYQKGMDSLAREYAKSLEKYRVPVSLTSGFLPGQALKVKMPVVLHSYNAMSNGSVAWAPKRMDAYTLPDMYGSEAQPWIDQLAVHESRHISQMQFGISRAWRPFKYIFGEMFNGLSTGLLTEISFLEGDAVIAETELTRTGRGRSADFLNYYMVCFDQGDLRDWDRWRYGSQKYYTPNHYASGYLTYGGIRWYYDDADFTARYLDTASRKPYMLWVREVISRQTSGMNVAKTFNVVVDSLARAWKTGADRRAPYMPMQQVTAEPRKHADYTDFCLIDGELYCCKEGMNDSRILIKVQTSEEDLGRERFVSRVAAYTSHPQYDSLSGNILWSESVSDGRWSLKATSQIRRMTPRGRRKAVVTRGGWMYNPVVSPSGKQVAAVELLPKGGSKLIVIDEPTGSRAGEFAAPDSLQLAEPLWAEEGIFATGLSAGGYGIYRLVVKDLDDGGGHWETVLEPQPVHITNPGMHGGLLCFTSDHNGVNELYGVNPSGGEVLQLTSTRYGATDYLFADDGYLYYSSQTVKGRMIFRTSQDSLLTARPVNWSDRARWIIADKLSEQASRRAEQIYGTGDYMAGAAAAADTISISAPRRWRKLPHLLHFHSWAPFYFSVPHIMNFSGEQIYDYISLGATALFQNNLGTAYGSAGYSAHRVPDENYRWTHSGHFYFRYSGWYPVIEGEVNVGDRRAKQYVVKENTAYTSVQGDRILGYVGHSAGVYSVPKTPYTEAKMTLSIPWNLSSGGWYRQLKPSVSYRFTNDRLDTRLQHYLDDGSWWDLDRGDRKAFKGEVIGNHGVPVRADGLYAYQRQGLGHNVYMQTLNASLLYYSLLPTTTSGEYSRWGYGAEIGLHYGLYRRKGLAKETAYGDIFSPVAYARIFGYFPGITREQGLKLSVLWQHQIKPSSLFGPAQSYSVMPRGFESKYPFSHLFKSQTDICKISADYAIPIYIGDRALLGGCFFIKRLLLIPYLDCTVYDRAEFATHFGGISAAQEAGLKTGGRGCLLSYGSQLMLDMTNALWLSLPLRFGIDFCINGAPGFKEMNSISSLTGTKVRKFFVGPVFSVEF